MVRRALLGVNRLGFGHRTTLGLVGFGSTIVVIVALGLVIALTLVGCTDPAQWDPEGEVHWVQWDEPNGPSGRAGRAVCSVSNSGRVDLSAVDLALSLRSSQRTYRQQHRVPLDLPPGKMAYATIEFPYDSPEETANLAALSIDSVAFH